MEAPEDRNLTVKEAAAYLRVTEVTLWRWRQKGTGPDWSSAGRKIIYKLSVIETWLAQNGSKKP